VKWVYVFDLMNAPVYNQKGAQTGEVQLPESVFAYRWNSDLVHQVVVSMQANARTPVAHTKDRSEVSGGGKKPWRQKGTGRARHGSNRSPIWRTGGVTFGPRNEKDYSKKINRKMRARALAAVLSRKFNDGEVLFVDELAFNEPKAKEAKEVLAHLSKINGFSELASRRNNALMVALGEKNTATSKSFRNFGNLFVDEARNLNPAVLLRYKYLILTAPDISIAHLARKFA
jgi:large subunit ribosomal protein L4